MVTAMSGTSPHAHTAWESSEGSPSPVLQAREGFLEEKMPPKLEGEQEFSPWPGGCAWDMVGLCGAHSGRTVERVACAASGYRMETGSDEGNMDAGRPARRLPPPPGRWGSDLGEGRPAEGYEAHSLGG